MGFWEKVGCATIGVGCKGRETIVVDQCEEMDNKWKEQHGEDYLTNRAKFPINEFLLQQIKSARWETLFGYDGLVREFCTGPETYNTQVGGGETCGTYADQDNSIRSQWCLNKEGDGSDATNRMRGNSKCTKEALGDKYELTASEYCKTHPEEKWCACYNFKNKVCDANPEAAGCTYYKILDQNKMAFGERVEREVPPEKEGDPPGIEYDPPVGYYILKDMAHCRPRSCDTGYIPENVKSDCEPTYKICDKDIDIRTHDNIDIILKCNVGNRAPLQLPDWWDEERDDSFWEDAREPPFDKFPLNKLPITRIPTKFNWKDINVRYLTYYTSASSSLCCLLLIFLMSSLKRR